MSFVSLDLCMNNPGALAFMMDAYQYAPVWAERGFDWRDRW